MDVTEKNAAPVAAADGDPAVEKKEVALADAIAAAANGIKDLHEQDEEGNVVDKSAEEAQAADEDKDAAIKRIIAEMVSKGMKPEDAEGFADALKGLAYAEAEAEDEDINIGEEAEKPAEDEDECAQLIQDGLKACGYDEEPEEFQKAFAEGVRYGERKERPSLKSSIVSMNPRAKNAHWGRTPRLSASNAASLDALRQWMSALRRSAVSASTPTTLPKASIWPRLSRRV